MTSEVAILRAYALATQGRYVDAEKLLKSVDGALDTLDGADLLARIRFEQGDNETAIRIWKQILLLEPSNEKALKALRGIDTTHEVGFLPKSKVYIWVSVIILFCAALWWMLPNHEVSQPPAQTEPLYVYVTNEVERVVTNEVERIVVQEVVKAVPEVIERVETNVVERVVEIMVPVETVVTVAVERVVCVTNEVRETVETEMAFVDDVVKNEPPPHPTALVYCPEYIVKPGDQVGRLAQKYKFRVRDFEIINPGVDSNLIIPGQRVKLPGFIHVEDPIE